MAGVLSVKPDSGNIIAGQPFRVIATITGDTSIDINTTTVDIDIDIDKSSGVDLYKAFAGTNVNGIFTQELILFANEKNFIGEPYSKYVVYFTSNTPSNLTADATFTAVKNPDLDSSTCTLGVTSFYLYDPNPVTFNGAGPTTANNPSVLASINPMTNGENGTPISDYYLNLRVSGPVRIYFQDNTTECLPYYVPGRDKPQGYINKDYYYYLIHKSSIDALNLNIYATDQIASQSVTFAMVINETEFFSNEVVFITTNPISVVNSLKHAIIEEIGDVNKLIRPDAGDTFTFQVPVPPIEDLTEYILGFVSNDQGNRTQHQLFISKPHSTDSAYYNYSVAYNELSVGNNYISYILSSRAGQGASIL